MANTAEFNSGGYRNGESKHLEYLRVRKELDRVAEVEFNHEFIPHVIFCYAVLVIDTWNACENVLLTTFLILILALMMLGVLGAIFSIKQEMNYALFKLEKGTKPRTAYDFEIKLRIEDKISALDKKKLKKLTLSKKLSLIKEESMGNDKSKDNMNAEIFKMFNNLDTRIKEIQKFALTPTPAKKDTLPEIK